MDMAQAKLKNLQISARKVRLVADLIRGKKVADAREILRFTVKRASEPIGKLLESAAANAEHAAHERSERIDPDEYVVETIMVNEGRTLHRFQPRARGRAGRIRRRSSHIELTISQK